MESTSQVTKPSELRTVLLGSGTAFSGVMLSAALLYVVRLGELIGFGGAIGVLVGSGILSALLMPIGYFLINRFKSGLWGRYHIALAVTTLISAICCVLAWSIDTNRHIAAKAVAVCICLPLCTTGLTIIAYICYSINIRLMGEERGGFKSKLLPCFVGLALGGISAALPLLGLGSASTGYGLGCLILIVGTVFYFASVGSLPRFVRPLSSKITFGDVRDKFLKKPTRSAVLGTTAMLVTIVSGALVLGYMPVLSSSLSLADCMPLVGASVAAVAAVAAYTLSRKLKLRIKSQFAASSVSCVLAVGVYLIARFVRLDVSVLSAVLCLTAAVIGALSGLSLAALRGFIAANADDTVGGVRFCLGAVVVVLGLSVGGALAAACALIPQEAGRLVFTLIAAVLWAAAASLGISEYVLKRAEEKKA